jgi:hypothetical protein
LEVSVDPVGDPELLRRMRLGDESALETLYARYGGLLCTLALRIVGDGDLAREVVQDTFARSWDGRDVGGVDGPGGSARWNSSFGGTRPGIHASKLRQCIHAEQYDGREGGHDAMVHVAQVIPVVNQAGLRQVESGPMGFRDMQFIRAAAPAAAG